MNENEFGVEPDLDDLLEVEELDDVDDLDTLLDGIIDDEYVSEYESYGYESLDEVAEHHDEVEEFNAWVESGAGWDEV